MGGKLALRSSERGADVGKGTELLLRDLAVERLDCRGHFAGHVGDRATKDLRQVEQADKLVHITLLNAGLLVGGCLCLGVLGLHRSLGCNLGGLGRLLLCCGELLVQGGLDGGRQAFKLISHHQKRWLGAKRLLLDCVISVLGAQHDTTQKQIGRRCQGSVPAPPHATTQLGIASGYLRVNLIGVEGLASVSLGFDVRDRPQALFDVANTFVDDREHWTTGINTVLRCKVGTGGRIKLGSLLISCALAA